jgi:hypothetical protein
VGNAPGQRQTVTVSGEHMQLHGVCVGTGSMIVDANGPGGQFTEAIGCAGSWSLTYGVAADQSPTVEPTPPSCTMA